MNTTLQASSGYQIRLEVLKMAKEMAEQEFYAQREVIANNHQQAVDFIRMQYEPGNPTVKFPAAPVLPSFPTPELIKGKANELYSFITTK